jgi:uncharacterized protein DUF6335
MAKRNARTSLKKGAKKTTGRKVAARRAGSAKKTRKTASAGRRKALQQARRGGKAAPQLARRATRPNGRASVRATRPKPPALQRERRKLTEDDMLPTPPSTLDFKRKASAAASGSAAFAQQRRVHTESGPDLTAGDVDADWGEAYADGDEAPGGDNPTPDQDVVEEIGRALGVEYDDGEELKGSEKITERDRHRWEYDPASAEDYRDRTKKQ